MRAGPPFMESAIFHHHVTMVAMNRQKAFALVYRIGNEIEPMKVTQVQGVFCQLSTGSLPQSCKSTLLQLEDHTRREGAARQRSVARTLLHHH